MSLQPLRALAPAKINLGLFVGPVREDGRHLLVTVMQSISLADELTLSTLERAAERRAGGGAADRLICPGVEGPPEENLAMRALRAFRRDLHWDAPPLSLSIAKRVPVAAGLGGGSGDAAAALRLAALASKLGDAATLERIAAGLGADVPAQVQPGRWLASGAGERLHELPAPAPFGVVVLPSVHALSTAAVYRELDRQGALRSAAELHELEVKMRGALAGGAALPPGALLGNDLQAPALSLCPQIEEALEEAREAGADAALLSGSGPTVLGLFGGAEGTGRAREAALRLSGRHPAAIAAVPVGPSFGAAAAVR